MIGQTIGSVAHKVLVPLLVDSLGVICSQGYSTWVNITNGPVLISLHDDVADDRIDVFVTIAGEERPLEDLTDGWPVENHWSVRAVRAVAGNSLTGRLKDLGAVLSDASGPVMEATKRTVSGVADFVDSPVKARLAAALAVTERVLAHPEAPEGQEYRDLLDHMWEWMTVHPDTFADWEAWSNHLLSDLYDRPGTSGRDIDPGLVRLLRSAVDLVYGHLFVAVTHPISIHDLHEVAEIGQVWGVQLPPAAEVRPFFHGHDLEWGPRLSHVEARDLRQQLIGRRPA